MGGKSTSEKILHLFDGFSLMSSYWLSDSGNFLSNPIMLLNKASEPYSKSNTTQQINLKTKEGNGKNS